MQTKFISQDDELFCDVCGSELPKGETCFFTDYDEVVCLNCDEERLDEEDEGIE